jgi:hypothetical protein
MVKTGKVQTGDAAGRLALAFGVALLAAACGRGDKAPPPPTNTLLKVETGTQTKLDPESALRCFVHGQFVGMQTPTDCAQKNGVPPGALDVGLDQSGSLAAGGSDAHLVPLANGLANATSDAGDAVDPTPPAAAPARAGQAGPPPADPPT